MGAQSLVFSNLIKGVSVSQVAKDFRLSESEVNHIFSFVLRKIKSYVFLRKQPMVVASTLEEARRYKMTCLRVLPMLNLEKPPVFKDIQNETVTPDNMLSITRNLNT